MDDDNESSGSLYESTSYSKDDDDLYKIFIAQIMKEYEDFFFYLRKTPQRTFMLSGAKFIRDILDDHPQTSYKLFQMDKQTFFNLCDHLKRHENLKDT